MPKAVMISIHPEWCDKIAYLRNEKGMLMATPGLKGEEVRKTAPNLPVPFKCYIYCTKDNGLYSGGEIFFIYDCYGAPINEGNGKVIGEFICNAVHRYAAAAPEQMRMLSKRSCVPVGELVAYAGDSGGLYGLGISKLTIYKEPKSLWHFCKPCDPDPQCDCNYCRTHGRSPDKRLKRAPQSWCYVEEVNST